MTSTARQARAKFRRDDTTSAEYQRAWRGRHATMTGVWSYPTGDGRQGTRYLRCNCGWRVVGVYAKPHSAQARRAYAMFNEHYTEVTAAPAATLDELGEADGT